MEDDIALSGASGGSIVLCQIVASSFPLLSWTRFVFVLDMIILSNSASLAVAAASNADCPPLFDPTSPEGTWLAEERDVVLPRPRPPRPRGPVGDRSADCNLAAEPEEEVGGMAGRFLREKRLKVRFCAGLAMAY